MTYVSPSIDELEALTYVRYLAWPSIPHRRRWATYEVSNHLLVSRNVTPDVENGAQRGRAISNWGNESIVMASATSSSLRNGPDVAKWSFRVYEGK